MDPIIATAGLTKLSYRLQYYLIILCSAFLVINGQVIEDVGIRMCRLRNCTIAEDLRPSLARAGFSINKFNWYGFRTCSNTGAFYKSLGNTGYSTETFLSGGNMATQLVLYGDILQTNVKFRPSSYSLIGMDIEKFNRQIFPQVQTTKFIYTVPDSSFRYSSSKYYDQKTEEDITVNFISTEDIVLNIVQDQDSEQDQKSDNNVSVFDSQLVSPSISSPPPLPPSPSPPLPPSPTPTFTTPSPTLGSSQGDNACIATPIARITATNQLSILLRALQAANLVEFLSNPEIVVTLFAPTDVAFEGLLSALGDIELSELLSDTELITAILLLHIVPDFALSAEQLRDNRVLTTLLPGQNLTIGVTGSVTTVVPPQVAASANILVADVPACESIIHVIDGVFLGTSDSTEAARSAGNVQQLLDEQQYSLHLLKVCEAFPPCCSEYSLKVGEGLCDVANTYEIECDEFRDLNDVSFDEELQAGDVLQVC